MKTKPFEAIFIVYFDFQGSTGPLSDIWLVLFALFLPRS